jgi:hypothetical protein
VQAVTLTCGDVNPDPEVAEEFECGPNFVFNPAARDNTDLSTCCLKVTADNFSNKATAHQPAVVSVLCLGVALCVSKSSRSKRESSMASMPSTLLLCVPVQAPYTYVADTHVCCVAHRSRVAVLCL